MTSGVQVLLEYPDVCIVTLFANLQLIHSEPAGVSLQILQLSITADTADTL